MVKDRFWNVTAALAGVLALVATVLIFFYGVSQSERQLEATVVSTVSVINPAAGGAREKIRITYENAAIPNIILFLVRFHNSAGQTIRKADFEGPMRIQIMGADRIISAEVVDADPPDLSPAVAIRDKTVSVEGALMNRDDQFTVEIATIPSGVADPVIQSVSGRIAGIRTIKFRSTPIDDGIRMIIWVQVVAAILAALVSQVVFGLVRRRVLDLSKSV